MIKIYNTFVYLNFSKMEDELKKEHKRSAAYPSLSVSHAYEFALKINSGFSANTIVNRGEIAHNLKLHENTVSRDVAACVQYGLLSREKEGYKLTQLFCDIFRPESEKEKRQKFIIAFGTPRLFQDLIGKFDGHVVPQELANTLIRHHGITEAASKSTADIFLQSATEVGVLADNKVLKYSVTLSTLAKTQYAEIITEENPSEVNGSKENRQLIQLSHPEIPKIKDKKDIPIHLTKNKTAFFSYPSDITENDIQIIEHEIKGILLRIKLEKEDVES